MGQVTESSLRTILLERLKCSVDDVAKGNIVLAES